MKNTEFLLKYSLRNLKRNPKRTLILFLAITFSCALVVWAFNINRSGLEGSIKQLTSMYIGKFQANHKEFSPLSQDVKLHKYLTLDVNQPEFKHLAPRAYAPIFISGEKKTIGTLMVGIDPAREKAITRFYSSVKTGNFFSDKSIKRPVLIGEKLAKRLNVKVGDEVVVLGQGLDGSIANDLFTIIGYYDVGGGDMEDKVLFSTLEALREFMVMPENSYHSLVGMDEADMPMLAAKDFEVLSWKRLMVDIYVSLDFLEKLNFVLTLIIVFVVSLGVSNTLFVSFNERQKEISSLNIIGANSRWITLSLMLETFSMMVVAIILGSVITTLVSNYFNANPIDLTFFSGGNQMMAGGVNLNPVIQVENYLKSHIMAVVMITVFVTLAMIYPIARVIKRSKRAS